ncbi:hypothetical protein F0562_010623 [Nyssa sinensis]|uniref:Uncharacterized protein n=1 Tax=Nyssa sinensis TaxID=561372 RepID=A0A5J5A151_9ASTE|nr:hypothetical protein F0562_010623 [Nyssa sinensis]
MHTSTPVAAMRDSPSRLTWADQANSGEFIPKEALDLEKEYGGFSINTDFLLCSNSRTYGEANNGCSKEKGFGRGESHARAKLASIQPRIPSHQEQVGSFAFQQNTQVHPSSTIASKNHMLSAMPPSNISFACPSDVVAIQQITQTNSKFTGSKTIGSVVSQQNQLATHRHLAVDASAAQKPSLWPHSTLLPPKAQVAPLMDPHAIGPSSLWSASEYSHGPHLAFCNSAKPPH